MKILVAGCGSIGSRHAANAAKMADTAVVDERPEAAKKCAEENGVNAFSNLEEALSWRPNGVIIATPTNMHLKVAKKVLEKGVDLLIEKPIADRMSGLNDFLSKAKEKGSRVFVVCNMRFHSAVSALHEALNKIGHPYFAKAHYGYSLPLMRPGADYRKLYCSNRAQGGGVILDAIHEIDYLTWFFGPAKKVTCKSNKLSDLDIDVEDFACLCLEHDSGFLSEIHMDYLRPFKRRGCEIVGDEGMLLWQSEGKSPEVCNVRFFSTRSKSWETLLSTENLDLNEPYEKMLGFFMDAINGKDVPLLNGDDAVGELSIALKALRQD